MLAFYLQMAVYRHEVICACSCSGAQAWGLRFAGGMPYARASYGVCPDCIHLVAISFATPWFRTLKVESDVPLQSSGYIEPYIPPYWWYLSRLHSSLVNRGIKHIQDFDHSFAPCNPQLHLYNVIKLVSSNSPCAMYDVGHHPRYCF